jgi:hypothetical protein
VDLASALRVGNGMWALRKSIRANRAVPVTFPKSPYFVHKQSAPPDAWQNAWGIIRTWSGRYFWNRYPMQTSALPAAQSAKKNFIPLPWDQESV